ncbi:hypothetical protein [Anaeromicropila herbilytica]|uniref:Uncharacterized protein n=1 Tax=Anaeromicropila herbilytica TaxID=2785025 RepID=A0A7R7EN43_9FIRM|nr:hypothetical protein [Anaeromicropila herbilytica]BCN31884.1 hypothetical protein bsdtb5_31790 [Anaeromicropila herbilytica]
MKKRTFYIISVSFIIIILAIFLPLLKNEKLTIVKSEDVSSIGITKWNGNSVTISNKDKIDSIIQKFKSIDLKRKFWSLGTPNKWSYRISILVATDDSSQRLYECFYLTEDNKIYKGYFSHTVNDGEIDSTFFSNLLN